jgi:hypothetical protein
MFCLVKSMGLIFDLKAKRPWTVEELMTSMGLPITARHQALVGTTCGFSRGFGLTNEVRSRRAACMEVGNAMHVAVIGSCVLFCLLRFPSLGESVAPARAAQPDEAPSEFAQAFARLKRRRM